MRRAGLYKRFERRLRAYVFYRGDRFECIFCGRSYSRFLPGGVDIPSLRSLRIVGGSRRENARCPACRSTDRERLLFPRLAVFANGFDLNACRIVCGGVGLERFETAGLLTALVEKSLVETEVGRSGSRFRIRMNP